MADSLREHIEREYVVERAGWACERIARVCERLQRDVAPGERLDCLVVWWSAHNAFTTFGRTIYLSRRLLERLPDDDAAAFVVAHEIAHHRLRHVPPYDASYLLPVRVVIALLGQIVCGAEREHDADRLAIELCVAAGYDPERCVAALDIMTSVLLDLGDLHGALGERTRRGHPTVATRLAVTRAHLAGLRTGAQLDVRSAIARDRARRRRRLNAALTGVATAAAVLLLLGGIPRRWR